ncbi:PDZ domain-containing protein [Sphingomonas sp. MMS24-JH45]
MRRWRVAARRRTCSSTSRPAAGRRPSLPAVRHRLRRSGAAVRSRSRRSRADTSAIPDRGRPDQRAHLARAGGAAFRNAGLRDGDVVTAIGGRAVAGPSDLDRLTREAASGALSLTVERGGQSLPLTAPVAPR